MTNKYKVSDLAKDFNMKSKDLIANLQKALKSKTVYAMGPKGKYMVTDELDNIFRFDTQEETKEFAEEKKPPTTKKARSIYILFSYMTIIF